MSRLLNIAGILFFISLGYSATAQWKALEEGERINQFVKENGQIYCGEIACGAEPIDVDVNSFKVWLNSDYSMDENNVYYPIQIVCIDYENCGLCYCDQFKVNEANAANFRYLGKDYATDGEHVFFRGELMGIADGKTFKVINGTEFMYFATDKNNVYIHYRIFELADPGTFYFDSTHHLNDTLIHQSIVKDKQTIWLYKPPYYLKKLK